MTMPRPPKPQPSTRLPASSCRSRFTFVGVDPGFTGAIAAINDQGRILACYDMPVLDAAAEGRAREYDLTRIKAIIVRLAMLPRPLLGLEWPNARPGEAANAMQRFGVGLGYIAAAAEGLMPVQKIAPNLWKGRLGLPGVMQDKHAKRIAVEHARSIFPGSDELLRYHSKHHGRAEALLIAYWIWSRRAGGMRVIASKVGRHSADAHAFVLTGRRGVRHKQGRGQVI